MYIDVRKEQLMHKYAIKILHFNKNTRRFSFNQTKNC